MILDISALENAVRSLDIALQKQKTTPDDDLIRDGCIQRFEYTYELSHKMLKRFLMLTEPDAQFIAEMTFQTLIRTGFDRGLLAHSWDIWHDYREKRGITSHTYSAEKARIVFSILPDFLAEAQFLVQRLHERNRTG